MMSKLLKTTLPFIIMLVLSCNTSKNQGNVNKVDLEDVSHRFIGQWKFYAPYPAEPKYDGSMDGIICGLEKYENTDSSFVFHLWMGKDVILSIQDQNTLTGQNASVTVKYNNSSSHLIVLHKDGTGIEFSKVK